MATYVDGHDIPYVLHRNKVPRLQSITLAIDSNWGESYSCIYRFRVHDE